MHVAGPHGQCDLHLQRSGNSRWQWREVVGHPWHRFPGAQFNRTIENLFESLFEILVLENIFQKHFIVLGSQKYFQKEFQ